MVTKSYQEGKETCVVTFYVRKDDAQSVEIVGEWNDWKPEAMKRKKDGTFWISKHLKKGRSYRFKYLIDGHLWENEMEADQQVPNPFGTTDSLINI
ncbi:MAG: isoamylase early set domain-containing protein [Aquificaceae bacterium]|nr:isoamylase early set domain-containing protein [Aquificaceae bacterium]MCS7307922.1 isoamylase early set domain-containing protein [Aquificaceae bacterium]MDW8433749.1 isoamylase early set domain-containing protein [Aquificaceae bacterium]